MIDYVDEIVVAYDKALKDLSDDFNAVTKKKNVARTRAAPDDLFIVNKDAEKLSEEGAMAFHNLFTKTLYVSKRARPDVSMAIAFLTTRMLSKIGSQPRNLLLDAEVGSASRCNLGGIRE
jgi:hypothetical protein